AARLTEAGGAVAAGGAAEDARPARAAERADINEDGLAAGVAGVAGGGRSGSVSSARGGVEAGGAVPAGTSLCGDVVGGGAGAAAPRVAAQSAGPSVRGPARLRGLSGSAVPALASAPARGIGDVGRVSADGGICGRRFARAAVATDAARIARRAGRSL